ncbi:hypothetical protein [Caproicibacter sp.]|uniref:hypothetical protein n=1 Tax=Caproicibacter sp. TaxID=2814884 RepID=UPI0039898288
MKKSKILIPLFLILLLGAFIFVDAPNLNPLYREGLSFWGFLITAVSLFLWFWKSGVRRFTRQTNIEFSDLKKGRVFFIVAAAPWAIFILVSLFSSVLFHVNQYKNQMPEPENRVFSSDVQAIDISQLPVVDKSLASLLADKKLGEKPSLGSQVTLGEPTIQKVNDKLVWAVPLLHSGFFKWVSNSGGTPGYILVSATNPKDVTYVDSYAIKYQPNAYLLDNLQRHVRFSGGFFTGLTDYSFEINDEGKPYWVVTTYKYLAGYSLPEADGAIIIDAATGKSEKYGIGDIPGWVDRVQPVDFVMTQINNRGNYIHGLFNFSNKDKFQTSEGNAIVYNNGRCYLYTGLTSVGADESTTGFIMVDMVTKTPYRYQISGATEYAAQKSAEGKVQNMHYRASFPLITNVDGRPAYFMTLKDDGGLIKQYAFVSVTDYTSVGTGETIGSAISNYQSVVKNVSGSSSIDTGDQEQNLQGTIDRISSQIVGENTVYSMILKEQPEKIFTAVADISQELPLTREGDRVKITYIKADRGVISLSTFDNLEYTQK